MSPLLVTAFVSYMGYLAAPDAARALGAKRANKRSVQMIGALLGAMGGYRASQGKCCVWNAIRGPKTAHEQAGDLVRQLRLSGCGGCGLQTR